MPRMIEADALMDIAEQQGYVTVDDLINAEIIEAEPVKHGRWADRYNGEYANPLYECSECKGKALYKAEVDELGKERFVQALSATCPHCRAKMDGGAENG